MNRAGRYGSATLACLDACSRVSLPLANAVDAPPRQVGFNSHMITLETASSWSRVVGQARDDQHHGDDRKRRIAPLFLS